MMKKVIYAVMVTFVFAISFSSCNKCQECTVLGSTSDICRDDYSSDEDYNNAIAAAELFGTCK